MSQERPAALETAPEGWRPRSAAPWRRRGVGGNLGMGTRRVRPGGGGRGPPFPGRRQVTPPPAPPSAGRGPDANGALSRPGGGRGWGSGWAAACARRRARGRADSASAPQEQSAPRAGERASSTHRGPASLDAGPGNPPRPGRGRAPAAVRELRGRGRQATAALGGRSSDAAAAPFSGPGPCSTASSPSPGPRRRRRLSLGAAPAAALHQGRAGPRATSRKVRAGGRLPQLLVAIFNPPPPPALSTSRAGWLTDGSGSSSRSSRSSHQAGRRNCSRPGTPAPPAFPSSFLLPSLPAAAPAFPHPRSASTRGVRAPRPGFGHPLPQPARCSPALSAGVSGDPTEKGPLRTPEPLHPWLDVVTSDDSTQACVRFTPAGV